MRFLKMLFWVLVAVFVAILASQNWYSITINLWGDLQVDIKVPVLFLIIFLIGFIPPWIILRGRIWQLRRRLEARERQLQFDSAQPATTPTTGEAQGAAE